MAVSRVFYDDFSDGTLDAWTTPGRSNPEVLAIAHDGGGPHSGSYFCALNITSSGFDGVIIPSWSFGQEHLIRLWMRYDSDVTYTGGYKMLRHGYHAVAADDTMTFAINLPERLDPTVYLNDRATGRGAGPNVFWDNEWHKIEIYVKADVDGAYKVWADDSIILDYSGNTIPGDGDWDSLHIPSNHVGHQGTLIGDNHMYIDSVEIFSDMGTGAIGSLSDATVSVPLEAPPEPSDAGTPPPDLVADPGDAGASRSSDPDANSGSPAAAATGSSGCSLGAYSQSSPPWPALLVLLAFVRRRRDG
jgi:hypothetical protein